MAGSSTTGIAANLCGRRYLGIEKEACFSELGMMRRLELDSDEIRRLYKKKLSDLNYIQTHSFIGEPEILYGSELPF
ncbi:MAG: site-specific DNA-methyltransferase [Bacteroidales bacterium]|nr:site-specific DNA-methyltransferase [Bacteroidales bacterium]